MKNIEILNTDCLYGFKTLYSCMVDFILTSPPYFNLKEYSNWATYDDYIHFIHECIAQCYRVLKPGRHMLWNIQDNIPEPSKINRHYYPLMPDTINLAINRGFEWERNIVWVKNNATQIMFGSYPYSPNIIYSPVTESICVFRKPGKTDLDNKTDKSKIDQNLWNEYSRNVWNITPDVDSWHPAPFPKKLAEIAISFHSFIDDLVMDPFSGSGTTARVCNKLNRRFIGFESNYEYWLKSVESIKYQQPAMF